MKGWKGLWTHVKIPEYGDVTFNNSLISTIKSLGDVQSFILDQVIDIVEETYNTPMTVILGEINGTKGGDWVDPLAGQTAINAIIKLKELLR